MIKKILPALLLLSGSTALQPLYADHTDIYFSEPYSGKRVQSYRVELYVVAGLKKPFVIPADCEQIEITSLTNPEQWGTQVDRVLWPKVVNDCQYNNFVHRYSFSEIKDYVSCYDFMNARIADFPMRWSCEFDTSPAAEGCESMHYRIPDVSRLPSFEQGEPDSDGMTAEACLLENGVFRGRILFGEDGLFCKKDRYGPGFRIISVDFADTNSDGYMDAIIRLIPIGSRVSRVPILYLLTKKGADKPFIAVPE